MCESPVPHTSVEQNLDKLFPIVIRQIDLDLIPSDEIEAEAAFNVLINVCWSAGELGTRASRVK